MAIFMLKQNWVVVTETVQKSKHYLALYRKCTLRLEKYKWKNSIWLSKGREKGKKEKYYVEI